MDVGNKGFIMLEQIVQYIIQAAETMDDTLSKQLLGMGLNEMYNFF